MYNDDFHLTAVRDIALRALRQCCLITNKQAEQSGVKEWIPNKPYLIFNFADTLIKSMSRQKKNRTDESKFLEVLVEKLTLNHGAAVLKEEKPLFWGYLLAIRQGMASCTLVNLAKALSKDIDLKIPISRATASRNRQLVRDILVAVIKKETDLKGFLHDVKVVEGLERNKVKCCWQEKSTITIIARV